MKQEEYCTQVFRDTTLSSTAKIVYHVLTLKMDENNKCNLTAEQLAQLVGSHRLSVVRALKDLETQKIISFVEGLSIKNRPQFSYIVHN